MKRVLFTLLLLIICVSNVDAQQKKLYKSITYDKIKKSDTGLTQLGWMGWRHSSEIKSSPWSVGCETLDRDF
ncbi:MAG: hypothetical protein Q4G59_04025, partial [Planctomycetia bacterium]|nr:hypothetical protein [Planctomycetia bacterium]